MKSKWQNGAVGVIISRCARLLVCKKKFTATQESVCVCMCVCVARHRARCTMPNWIFDLGIENVCSLSDTSNRFRAAETQTLTVIREFARREQ